MRRLEKCNRFDFFAAFEAFAWDFAFAEPFAGFALPPALFLRALAIVLTSGFSNAAPPGAALFTA